jgi:hypothetical protein
MPRSCAGWTVGTSQHLSSRSRCQIDTRGALMLHASAMLRSEQRQVRFLRSMRRSFLMFGLLQTLVWCPVRETPDREKSAPGSGPKSFHPILGRMFEPRHTALTRLTNKSLTVLVSITVDATMRRVRENWGTGNRHHCKRPPPRGRLPTLALQRAACAVQRQGGLNSPIHATEPM